MKPVYAEELVVAIKHEERIEWFILNKDLCYLDYAKLETAYRKRGYEVTVDGTSRFGIKIVNELTQESFLDNIKGNRITTDELKRMLMCESTYNDRLAYNPSILIDFDNRVFMSHYAEPESFEDFAPNGWRGRYQNFEESIPPNQRYWLDENGRNLIRQ